MLALVLAASLVLVRWVGGPLKQMAPYTDLFFMGVAFLLLETKNVVQFALLFGTTWAVNAAVFTGVLLSVLAAIEVARRVRIARPVLLYPALLAALVLAWVVPGDLLLDLSPVPRFLVGVTIAFLPIFVANLIFAVRFKGVGQLDDGLRREPARRDGGWRAGVPRAHPRLQRAARRRGGLLHARPGHRPQAPRAGCHVGATGRSARGRRSGRHARS